MKKIAIFLIIFMLVLMNMTLSVSGEIMISGPETITLNMIGGDNITRNITITFPCDNPSSFSISTNVTPDGYGLNITYNYDFPEDIIKDVEYVIKMFINASIHIAPNNYSIITVFYCECQTSPAGNGDNGGGGWDHSGSQYWEPVDPSSGYTPEDLPTPDTLPDETELKDPDDEVDDEPQKPFFFIYPLAFCIIILFLIFLIYLYKKKGVEKK